jgi:hypothetical protein
MGYAMYDAPFCGRIGKNGRNEYFNAPATVAFYAVRVAPVLSAIVMVTLWLSCCMVLPRWVLQVTAAASAVTGVMESLQFLLFQSFLMDEPYNGRWMWGCNATVVAVMIALTTAIVILWCLPPPKDDNPVEHQRHPAATAAVVSSATESHTKSGGSIGSIGFMEDGSSPFVANFAHFSREDKF